MYWYIANLVECLHSEPLYTDECQKVNIDAWDDSDDFDDLASGVQLSMNV